MTSTHIIQDWKSPDERRLTVQTKKILWLGAVAYLSMFIDNTKIIEKEKSKMKAKMQKMLFVSVTHELKTPLNAIMTSLETMK